MINHSNKISIHLNQINYDFDSYLKNIKLNKNHSSLKLSEWCDKICGYIPQGFDELWSNQYITYHIECALMKIGLEHREITSFLKSLVQRD